MSVFKGHEDLSLNRYYYSFYSFSQSDPYTIKSFVYDQNQTLIFAKDISFNSRNVPAMLTFLENSQSNPYALGKSNDEYLNMDIAFAGLYKKALSQKQQQTLMTSINNTYKNVYYGTVKTFTVQVQPSSADSNIPVFILNQNTNDENPDVMVGTVGLYIFDQSHPSNANYPLAFRNIGTQTPYTTNVIVEGTPGTPNSYTLITIDNVSSRMYVEYHTTSTELNADSISGELFNYVYQVHVVNNVFGDPVFSIQSPGESAFVEQPDLSFNSGDFALFYVGDSSMEPYNLVFGTTIDDNTSVIQSQFYNETEDGIITLDLTSDYTEGPVYYFEDTSAGMGYVSPYSNIVATTVLIREDFNNTSVLDGWGKNVSYVYNYNLVGDPLTFVNGDYAISQSDYEVGQNWHQYLHRLVNNSGDAHDGYDWHTSKGSYINDPTNINNGKAKSNIYTNGVQGSWIQMKMPYKMNVKSVSITGRNSNGLAHPRDAHLFGSNDNGSTFHHIGDISFNQQQANQTVDISSNTDSYDLLRMVVSRTYNQDHCHIDYWALIGDVYQFVEPVVNTYTVEVSNNAFWIQRPGDSGLLPKPVIDLTDITTVYLFDQSDSSNIGNQLVIGTSPDISSSIVSSSTTTMGTPGQPGAYTKYVSDGSIVYYFSYQNENMGEEPLTYTVKVVNHEVTDKPVFSIKAPTPVDASFIVQPNISFDAGDKYQFDIRDQTMTDLSLVFGTTVDNIGTVNESIVSRYDGTIILGISNIYGSQFVYFEESSAGMGYVPASISATLYTVEVSDNAFWIQRPQDTGLVEKAPISFSSGTTYLFDQSHFSNAGNTLVIGTNVDVSSSVIPEVNGLTIMGTPGQPGAYTQYNANRSDVVYFSYQNENMGEELLTYTVRVENHEVTDKPVFSIKAPTPVDASFIVQPNISFGAGDKYQFDIRDQTMTDFSLVFGTTVDNIGTVNESFFSRYDGTIVLGVSPSYNNSNGRFLYFEDSSAGMGYVPSSSGATLYTVEVSDNAFWIQRPQDTGLVEKAPISFSSGTTYLFDQSHFSNAGNTLVIGTNVDVSSSVIPEVNGLTIMGTPGQPGAYTQYNANRSDVVYFSYQNETMGYLVPFMISISNTSVYPGGFTTITVKNNFDIDGRYTLILTNITQNDLSNADLSGSIPRNTETIFTYNIPYYVNNIGSFTYSIDGTDISSVVELPPVNKYNVDVSDNSYWLQKFDTIGPLGANYQQPALPTFIKDIAYEFHYDDTIGHPFALSTTLNGTFGTGGTEYTSGVTRENEGTSSAVLKLTATENVSLNYYCKIHSNYGNDGGSAQYVTYLEQMTLHIKFDDGDMGNLNYNGNNPYNTITNHGTNTISDIHLLRPPHRNVTTISAIEDPTTDAYTGSSYIRYSPLTKIDTSDKKYGTGSLYTAYDNGAGPGNTERIQITNGYTLVSNDPGQSTAYTGTFMVWFKRANDSRLLDQNFYNPFFTTYSSDRGFRINIDRDRDTTSPTYNIYFVQLYEDSDLIFLTDDPAPGNNFGKITNWNHYAFTSKVVDGGTHNVTIYLNGSKIRSKNVSNNVVNRSANGFYDNQNPWCLIHPNWYHYYKGHIDDVRFYDECLPDSEITRVYNETK